MGFTEEIRDTRFDSWPLIRLGFFFYTGDSVLCREVVKHS
jgi:hypothetical protein